MLPDKLKCESVRLAVRYIRAGSGEVSIDLIV